MERLEGTHPDVSSEVSFHIADNKNPFGPAEKSFLNMFKVVFHHSQMHFGIFALAWVAIVPIVHGIEYCTNPKQGANCDFWRTNTCCVSSTSQASCKWGLFGSKWDIESCPNGHTCAEGDNGETSCASNTN